MTLSKFLNDIVKLEVICSTRSTYSFADDLFRIWILCLLSFNFVFGQFRYFFHTFLKFLDIYVSFLTISSDFGYLHPLLSRTQASLLGCSSRVFDEGRLATNEKLKMTVP